MLHWVSPWFFILLPVPWLLWYWLPPAPLPQTHALKIPFYSNLKISAFEKRHGFAPQKLPWSRLLLATIAWVFLLTAASGPEWLGALQQLPRSGRDILLAVDLSGSMETPDMALNGQQVTRLQLIKHVAQDFIENRVGDKLGLILFGTRAYLQAPLTYDRKTVAALLTDASVGLAGEQTAIGDAIGLGIKRLTGEKTNRVMILLTDGANNTGNVSPLDAAAIAAKQGVHIYTIGLGAKQAMIYTLTGPQMINPTSDLDEKTLADIARLTGGLYFRATDAADLQQVYARINALEPVNTDHATYRRVTPLYPWPLFLALLISIVWAFRHIATHRLLRIRE